MTEEYLSAELSITLCVREMILITIIIDHNPAQIDLVNGDHCPYERIFLAVVVGIMALLV